MMPWHALVIEGSLAAARGFVAGFLAGRGARGGAVFRSDIELAEEHESLGARLRALFAADAHEIVLAPADLARSLTDALRTHGRGAGLRLADTRVVTAASGGFRAHVFSRELAQDIRRDLLLSLPEGVRIEALSESEEVRPEAEGPEPYAPLHAYTYTAAGRFVGALAGVLEMQRRGRMRELVAVEPVRLEEAPATSPAG